MVNARAYPPYPQYRCGGRFYGRRVNCEWVPQLPGWVVDKLLRTPRNSRHLLLWRSRSDETIQEAVCLAHYEVTGRRPLDWTGAVEIRGQDGTGNIIRTLSRALRQGGGFRLLVCPVCNTPRRALYGWEPGGQYTTSAVRSGWQCRVCAKLRYASEGGALVHRSRGNISRMLEAAFGPCRQERPRPWYPEVFTSPREARKLPKNLRNLLEG